MKLGIAAQAAAVLEQPRVVGGDALKHCCDRALDLGVGRARVPEQRPVVHERAEQIDPLSLYEIPGGRHDILNDSAHRQVATAVADFVTEHVGE